MDRQRLYHLFLDDLERLDRKNVPAAWARIFTYPNDYHHKGVSGIIIQHLDGHSPSEHFCDLADDAVTDCFVYCLFGHEALSALCELKLTLLQHTKVLTELFRVERSRLVASWMVALARTDVGYTPGSYVEYDEDGVTKGTLASVPNIVVASRQLAEILRHEKEIAQGDVGEDVDGGRASEPAQQSTNNGAGSESRPETQEFKSREWNPDCDQILRHWIVAMKTAGKKVGREGFIRKYIAKRATVKKWKDKSAATFDEKFKANRDKWEDSVKDVIQTLKNGAETGAG
ncbi:MAG: hypothetical protein ABGX16_00355 [Pirellulales bacterium]